MRLGDPSSFELARFRDRIKHVHVIRFLVRLLKRCQPRASRLPSTPLILPSMVTAQVSHSPGRQVARTDPPKKNEKHVSQRA